ncbi:ABC transporter ATP-binding protein [Halothermothrix orenii]|uniref:ABC transporter related n=1 Tax=Halothermothrix orenii (strain H 168 / OCM 544 / DSM 9562) TaxID=373903 RepID=B8CZJ5_HALOH|nr:ABC transporter ATP-binding protein [Halothermothrix orenii]ACL70714.1 ABC transporter related [Halothermothrix orenii H 168]
MTILKARGIKKVYTTQAEKVYALKGVDLEINKGDFIVINGPSGSGKTTLLNILSGVDRPTEGEVYIDGKPLSELKDSKRTLIRRNKIGLVFQSFELIPVLTARENVEYPLLLQKIDRSQRKKRVDCILDQVGLLDMADRRPSQLSGGQKQRVAIARALVTEPDVVLADEPTGNLDTGTGRKIIELMNRLNHDFQVSFVIVTHDLSINQYARKLIKIRDGRLEVNNYDKNSMA